MRTEDRGGRRVLVLDAEGPRLASADDATKLIGEAWGTGAELVAVPVHRLDPAFFDLRTGIAGEFTQKLVNYRIALAVVGDITGHESASRALRDYVVESNRGEHVWFVPDEAALELRLAARRRGGE